MKPRYWYWVWKTFLSPSRLRKKFVRAFLTTGLIPLLLMGGGSFYLISLIHRLDVTSLEENLAQQVAREIDQVVENVLATLQLDIAFEEFAPIAFSQQQSILETALRSNPSLEEASFVCTTPRYCDLGKETSRVMLEEGSRITLLPSRDRSDHPGFLAAKDALPYFGDPQLLPKESIIELALPVFNKNREVIAVLAATMRLDQIRRVVETTKLGETGYLYLVDQANQIIAHKNPVNVGLGIAELPSFTVIKGLMEKGGGSQNAEYESLDGKVVTGAGALVERLHWGVIAEWPREETQRPVFTMLAQIAAFALLALLLIIFVASRLAYRMIGPIAYLNQGTSIIGSGNFGYRVDVKTGDELEDLGRNLNKMAENLQGLEELHELKLKTQYLSESLKKEQELSNIKDQFITTVSHQFNTPLSVIDWTLTTIKDKNATPEAVAEGLRKIDQSKRDMTAIVNDLLTLSEIGFGYKKANTKLVDFKTLLHEVLQRFSRQLSEKRLSLALREDVQNAKAEANEFAMTKVIENLVDNAITYSHEGQTIAIVLGGDLRRLAFSITDQGIGIPKEDQPLLFQQFFRARNAVEKKNVGTGLGLFIVKLIVEGHGGEIRLAASEQNRGTTFTFSIPR